MELFILSTITGLTTVFGVLMVTLYGQPGEKLFAFYLGLAAGMMTFVIVFHLLPMAFEQGPIEAVGMGMGSGILMMAVLHYSVERREERLPLSPRRTENLQLRRAENLRLSLLIALAISLHNIPEGMAIGAGFELHGDIGLLLALPIALHNIPVGMGMAVPLVLAGVRRVWILLLAVGVSLCIPLGAMLGKLWFLGSPFLMTMGIGFACGAMGYIVWKEIGPISFRSHPFFAQVGLGVSLLIMYLIHVLR
jgi:ZIP family zinc transporter